VRPDDFVAPHPVHGPPGAIAILTDAQLADVFDKAPRAAIGEDSALFGCWAELMRENAPHRVIEGAAVVSAPADHYDHLLMNAATGDWTRQVRLVGNALGLAFDQGLMVDSDVLFSRLAELARSGRLEAQGDVLGWAEDGKRAMAMVRRPD
jgi:hypothetical protein